MDEPYYSNKDRMYLLYQAMKDTRLKPSDFQVLFYLVYSVSWQEKARMTRPGVQAICRMTGISRRRVQMALKNLEEAQYIHPAARFSGGDRTNYAMSSPAFRVLPEFDRGKKPIEPFDEQICASEGDGAENDTSSEDGQTNENQSGDIPF